jgi:protein phosphatase
MRNEKSGKQIVFNRRIGVYYALIFLVCLALACLYPPWSLILLWPALSMLLITLGYWLTGPAVFFKVGGKIPLLSRLVLAPYLLGQQLYLRSYFNKCRPWDEPVSGLLIGRVLSAKEARCAIQEGVSAVVDMTAEFSESPPFCDLAYLNLQTLDLTAPHPACLQQGVEFIEREIQSGKVYVHCKIGYSRTAVMAGAYLIHSGRAWTVDEAVALLRKARPTLIVRPEAREALEVFYAEYVEHAEHKGRQEGAS